MIEKITIDDRELQQALLRFYKTKTPAQVMRAQARLMAVNLAFQTQPFGGTKAVGGQQDSAKNQGEGAVARDIRKAIKTPSDIFQTIEKQGIGAGRAFVAMMRKGDFDLARNLLVRLRVPGLMQAKVGTMSATAHKQALKPIPKRPRMSTRQEPLLITNDRIPLRQYVKEIQKKGGHSKGRLGRLCHAARRYQRQNGDKCRGRRAASCPRLGKASRWQPSYGHSARSVGQLFYWFN